MLRLLKHLLGAVALITLWILAPVAFLNGGAHASDERAVVENKPNNDPEPPQEPIVKLEVGKAIERELVPGATHLYSVELTVGDFAEIAVEQRGVDVVVAMFIRLAGSAKKLTEVDSPSGANAVEPLYWIADTQGSHVIAVLHLDPKAPAGKYTVTLVGKRQSTETDRSRLKAQQAFVDANLASNKRTAESFTQAATQYKIALELYRSLGDKSRELLVAARLGETLAGLQKHDEAIEYYKQALVLAEQQNQTAYTLLAQVRLAQSYDKSKLPEPKKTTTALNYFRQALEGYRTAQNVDAQAFLHEQIGLLEKKTKMTREAGESFSQAAAFYEKLNKKSDAAKQLGEAGAIYSGFDKRKAIEIYTRAEELYKQAGNLKEAEDSARAIAAIKEELAVLQVLQQWQDVRAQFHGTITAAHKKQIETFTGRLQASLIKAQQAFSDGSSGELSSLVGELSLQLGKAFSLLAENNRASVYFRQAAKAFDADGEYERADALRENPKKRPQALPQLVTQSGHTASVVIIALSADGKLLASRGLDGRIKIWETETGFIAGTLSPEIADSAGKSDSATDVLFISDGNVWKVASGELLRNLEYRDLYFDVGNVEFGFAAGARRFAALDPVDLGRKFSVDIFDAQSGRFSFRLAGHSALVTTVALSKNVLASGASNGELKIWDLENRRLLLDIETQATAKITKLEFSSDGKTLTAESEDKVVQVFNVPDGKLIKRGTVEQAKSGSNCQAEVLSISSPDGTVVGNIEGEGNDRLVVVDAKTCAVLNRFDYSWVVGGQYSEIQSGKNNAAFAGDGHTLASAVGNGINLWNYRTRKLIRRIDGFASKASSVEFSADGKNLHIKEAGYYQVFQGIEETGEATTGEATIEQDERSLFSLDLQSGAITGVAKRRINEYMISPDFRFGLFHTPRSGVYQYKDLETDRLVAQIPVKFSNVIFSPDGRRFLTHAYRGIGQLRDTESARIIKQFNNFKTFGFSEDGKTLIGLSGDEAKGGIYLFDAVNGRPLGQLQVEDEYFEILVGMSIVTGMEISSDRKRFTITESGVSGKNGGASLFSAETKSDLGTISGGSGFPILAFSHDSRFLAAENNESEINLLDAGSGQLLDVLLGHTSDLRALDFSADDRFLVSSSEDGTIHFWDVAKSELAATLVVFQDGEWLITTPEGFFDGTPAAWRRVFWRFQDQASPNGFSLAPIEIFFNDFFRPGVLAEILSRNAPQSSLEIALIDRRQPKVCLSLVKNGRPEACTAQNVKPTLSTRTAEVAVEVQEAPENLKTSEPAGGVRDLRLFRGGSLVRHWTGDVFAKESGCDVTAVKANGPRKALCRATVTIIAGDNELSAYAFNSQNVKSADATAVVNGANPVRPKGKLHILAIGVNEYANKDHNLKYAVPDAVDFAAELRKRQILLKNYDTPGVIQLTDAHATEKNILHVLERFAKGTKVPALDNLPDGLAKRFAAIDKVEPEDVVVIYFAGHGTAAKDRFYLIPRDGFPTATTSASERVAYLHDHSISDLELENALRDVDAGQMIMVIDACNSGQALEAEEKRRGPMNSKGLAQLAYEKGMLILTAAQSYQAALEVTRTAQGKTIEHGLLTYSLLEAFTTPSADADRNKQLIDREWLNYAVQQVPQMQLEAMRTRDADVKKGTRDIGINFSNDEGANLPPEKRGLQTPRVFYRRDSNTKPLVVAVR